MFGKIQSYKKKDRKVIVNFAEQRGEIEFITPTIVNIFAPINSDRRYSWAIEGEKGDENVSFEVSEKNDGIVLENEHLKIVVSDDFKVDIYDSEGGVKK